MKESAESRGLSFFLIFGVIVVNKIKSFKHARFPYQAAPPQEGISKMIQMKKVS